jgi:UDP-N-acetylmuramoyl-tripeptide--D-alanyl-D-alanine ligase
MLECSAADIASMAGGEVISGPRDALVKGVTVDSRKVSGAELFVALGGERFDGHGFVWRAFAAGCRVAMVSQELPEGQVPPSGALVRVGDTYAGLGQLAASYRRKFDIPWVGVTGSCGKSTTKELIALVLEGRGRVLKAEASFNNRVGLPLTILRADREHQFAVVELGSNHSGELLPLAAMASPDVAVITCVAPAHLAGFGNLDGVAEEKSKILGGLTDDGLAILNADDAYFEFFVKRCSGRVMSFGLSANAEVRGSDVAISPEGSEMTLPGGARVRLPLPGTHNLRNALAAAAVARSQGMDFPEIAERLSAAEPLHMRSRLVRMGGLLLLEDCYNANPASFLAGLEALDGLGDYRKVVIAGDMAELGRYSEEHHRSLGEEISGRGIELLVAVGSEARRISEAAARSTARVESHHFMDAGAAAVAVPAMLRDGDAVLVKGSRSIGLEVVVKAICSKFSAEGEG